MCMFTCITTLHKGFINSQSFAGDLFGLRRRRLDIQTLHITVRIVIGATPLKVTLSETIMSNLTQLVNGTIPFNVAGVGGLVFSTPTRTSVVLAPPLSPPPAFAMFSTLETCCKRCRRR